MDNKSNRARILERIKKLMALADDRGATGAEAMAAALAAQKLIAEYDVEDWELHSKDAEPIVEEQSDTVSRRWRWHLAYVIAPAFRCRFFENNDWNEETRRWDKRMGFFGYKTDARAAALTFNMLYRIGNRLARRYSKGRRAGTYNSYIIGYVNGIKSELEKQTQALMIVVPPKVNEAYEEFAAGFTKAGWVEFTYNKQASDAYGQGLQDGRDAVCSHRIDENNENTSQVSEVRLISA